MSMTTFPFFALDRHNDEFRLFVKVNKSINKRLDLTLSSLQSYTLMSLPIEGSLSMYELSKRIGVTCSSMTRIVYPLVRKGLVDRGHDNEDRRIVQISLTKKER
jgi:DNA-binding MarR family transcriptional regulator